MNPKYWPELGEPYQRLISEIDGTKLGGAIDYYIWRCFEWSDYYENPEIPSRSGDVCTRFLLLLGFDEDEPTFHELHKALSICRVNPDEANQDVMQAAGESIMTGASDNQFIKALLRLLPCAPNETEGSRFMAVAGMLLSPQFLRRLIYNRRDARFLLYSIGVTLALRGNKPLTNGIQLLLMDPFREINESFYHEFLDPNRNMYNQRKTMRYAIEKSWREYRDRFDFVMGQSWPEPPPVLHFIKGATRYIIDECECGRRFDISGYDGENFFGPRWEERGMHNPLAG